MMNLHSPVIVASLFTTIIMGIAGCQAAHDPATITKICSQLDQEQKANEKAFITKSSLHQLFIKKYGIQGVIIYLDERKAGKPIPNGSYGERVADGAYKACVPIHGTKRCKAVATDYAAYEDKAHNNMWKEVRYKCD